MRSNFSEMNLNLHVFQPIVSLMTGHSQTILGHVVPSAKLNIETTEYVLKLDDGDEILLEYINNNSNYTVSIYHGLAGSANADYVRRTAYQALLKKWNVVLVNHRGASHKASAKKTYHSGRGEDADAVISWCKEKFSNSKQIAVGFSMSGSILLNLLTYRYGKAQPDYAVVVNAPLDLARCAKLLTVGFSKIYDYRFYLILKKLIQKKTKIQMPLLGRTMDIDELCTSKMNGYRDAQDYYEKCSTLNYVNEIKTKTFILAAYDDPFIDIQDYLRADWNENVHLCFQKKGGHMGYYAKKKDPNYGHRWLDHYLGSVFEKIQSF